MLKNMGHGQIDEGVAAPALLVGRPAAIAYAGYNKAVLDSSQVVLVEREPGNGSYRAGYEKKPVAESRLASMEAPRQVSQQGQTGAVVIGERRMTDVGRHQEFVSRFSLVRIFPVGEMAVFQAGIYEHLIYSVWKGQKLIVRHAEAPALCVVGCAIGNSVGLI